MCTTCVAEGNVIQVELKKIFRFYENDDRMYLGQMTNYIFLGCYSCNWIGVCQEYVVKNSEERRQFPAYIHAYLTNNSCCYAEVVHVDLSYTQIPDRTSYHTMRRHPNIHNCAMMKELVV